MVKSEPINTSSNVSKGSSVADVIIGVAPPGSLSRTVLTSVANGVGSIISFLSGGSGLTQNSLAAVTSLSTAGTAKVNLAHPEGVPHVLRADYAMNHMGAVNQTVGIVNLFETSPISVYRAHANRLKNAGL